MTKDDCSANTTPSTRQGTTHKSANKKQKTENRVEQKTEQNREQNRTEYNREYRGVDAKRELGQPLKKTHKNKNMQTENRTDK